MSTPDLRCEPTRRVAPRRRLLDGAYELGDELAEGGFAIVYRARDLVRERDVAIKVLRERFCEDASIVTRFRRECRILRELHGPHIVTSYGHGDHYPVMELLDGVTIEQWCAQHGPMPWRAARDVLRAVALALGEAHALRILHRDVKPQNIHLGADGIVKLVDFGLARDPHGDQLTHPGRVVGTLPYLSPEQLCGAGCDARSDLYALGVVGYEMVTGVWPFPGASSPELLVVAMRDSGPIAPSELRATGEVPEALDRIVLRCLEPSRAARFASAGELAAALAAI